MQEILDRISYKQKLAAHYVSLLRLWDIVAKAGIQVDDVKSFTFVPDFLPREERAKLNRASFAAKRDVSKFWHNAVRLHDGSLKPIQLTKRPYPPEKPDGTDSAAPDTL